MQYNDDGTITITFREDQTYVSDNQLEEKRKQTEALFIATGWKVERMWRLGEHYGPCDVRYFHYIHTHPWWLIQTSLGLIKFGPRKRVHVIDWEAASFRGIITEDNVTKGESFVHAWTRETILEYLCKLRECMANAT